MINKSKRVQVWVTKHWSTLGIYTAVGNLDPVSKLFVPDRQKFNWLKPGQYFLNEQEAREHVRDKAAAKIVALRTKAAELELEWL